MFAQLSCDGPICLGFYCLEEPICEDSGDRNAVSQARSIAKKAGWRRIDGYDLCPQCAKRYKTQKEQK